MAQVGKTADGDGGYADGVVLPVRALTARSAIASTLLGMAPPKLSSQLLVRSGELFGIAEGTTRVALSRMVAAGELEAVGGSYQLAGHLLVRHERQIASRRPLANLRRWSGDWEIQIVTGGSRTARERGQLRAATRQLDLAEGREGVWLRPANLDPERLPDDRAIVAAQCTSFVGRPDHEDPAALAARLWDLEQWASTATTLRREMAADIDRLESGDTAALAPSFLIAASVVRHLVADPRLPPELCPASWPGSALRDEYDRYVAAYQRVWREWFRRQG